MNNWQKVKLIDVADIKLSSIDKKTKAGERKVRLCNYTDVYNNSYINNDLVDDFMIASCSESDFEKFILKKGQVAITKDSEKTDDIGIPTYVSEDFENVVLGYHLSLITPNEDKLDGKFLNYWLKTNYAKRYFENNATGSGQRCTLVLDVIKSIPIYLPSLSVQKQIAKVLFDLETKIELNNKINTELEAIAKALYDYWFIQFDFPNAGNKPFKSSGGKMVYNEEIKREIPFDWEVKKFNYFDLYQPKTISEKEMNDNGKYFVFGANGIVGKYNEYNHSESEIVITCRGNSCGTINRTIPFSWITGNAMVVKSKVEEVSTEFIYHTIKWSCVERIISGSGQPQITRTNLQTVKFVLPNFDILRKFNEILNPNVEKRFKIFEENQKLAELRDWLLPMLMNGQVTVKEAQEHINQAAEPQESYHK